MKTKEAIQEDEKRIGKWLRELPDNKRLLFFQQAEKMFTAKFYHFYPEKWNQKNRAL